MSEMTNDRKHHRHIDEQMADHFRLDRSDNAVICPEDFEAALREAEARGAEEQRRKDAEGQEPVAWQVRDMRGSVGPWKLCSERAHEEYKKHSTVETRPLYTHPANVAALFSHVREGSDG